MMRRLQERAEQLVRAERRRAIERLVAGTSERIAGVRVEATAQGLAISGRGLVRRWLTQPVLRFFLETKR